MDRQINYQRFDSEQWRWSQKYPQFPGVAECLRWMKSPDLPEALVDIIGGEIALHAKDHLPDLISAFTSEGDPWIRVFLLMSLADAKLIEAAPFFLAIVQSDEEPFVAYAHNALDALENPHSRTPYWKAVVAIPPG